MHVRPYASERGNVADCLLWRRKHFIESLTSVGVGVLKIVLLSSSCVNQYFKSFWLLFNLFFILSPSFK